MHLKKNKKSELKRISLLIILTFLVTILIASANNFTGPINITINETIIPLPIPPLEPECINDIDCNDSNISTLDFCIDNFCIYEPININQTNQTQPEEPIQIPPEPPQQPVPEPQPGPIPIPEPEPVQPIPGPQPQPIPEPIPPECQEDIDCDDNLTSTNDLCINSTCIYLTIKWENPKNNQIFDNEIEHKILISQNKDINLTLECKIFNSNSEIMWQITKEITKQTNSKTQSFIEYINTSYWPEGNYHENCVVKIE